MNHLEKFLDLQDFLIKYQEIWSIEPLNFFPKKFSSKTHSYFSILNKFSSSELLDFENSWSYAKDKNLNELLEKRSELLEITQYKEINEITAENKIGMSSKKRHEISRLSSYLKNKLAKNQQNTFFDIGAGVGHLVFSLYDNFPQKQFFVIDQDPYLIEKGSLKSQNKLKDKRAHIQFRNIEISKNKFPKIEFLNGVLHGLHCCGELSLDMIEWFLKSDHSDLILTSCCYHKLQNYNLSKHANLKLTDHALHLAAKGDNYQDEKSYVKKYLIKEKRYALGLFHYEKHGSHLEAVGSLPKLSYEGDILDYANKVYDYDFDKQELKDFYQRSDIQEKIKELIVQGVFRNLFAKPLEMYLILDRVLYLKEKGVHVELLSLFDREFSPRNLTIHAKKA